MSDDDSFYFSGLNADNVMIREGCVLTDGTYTYDSSTSSETLKALRTTTLIPTSDTVHRYNVILPSTLANGSITAPASAVPGETVSLTVSADEGYAFKSISVNGTPVECVNGVYSFVMPDNNAKIKGDLDLAVKTALFYGEDAETGNIGANAVDGNVCVYSGFAKITGGNGGEFTSLSNPNGGQGGFAINGNIEVKGGEVIVTGGDGGRGHNALISFARGGRGGNGISGSATLSGGTLTYSGGKGGTGYTTGADGNGVTGSVKISKGYVYRVDGITYKNILVNPNSFSGRKLVAVYQIHANNQVGLGNCSYPQYAEPGETVTVDVTADTGYKIISVTVNGETYEVKDGKFTFTMPAADVTITAEFEQINYKISKNAEHCTVSVPETAHYNDSVTMTVTPDPGYRLVSVIVDGTALEPEDGKYTFTMPLNDVNAKVVCEQIDYTITKSSDYGAVFVIVNGTMAETAHYGDTVYVFASALGFGSTYKLKALTITDENNNKVELNGSTFVMPAGNVTVTAFYEHEVDLSALTENYTAQDGDVLKGTTSYTVLVADGAEVTLKNANISGGIVCEGSADITLAGDNTVTGATYKACIQVGGEGTTLTIKGDGSLTSNGGLRSAGIGLGASWGLDHDVIGGNIVIESGKITANGGKEFGAGIGTGACYSSSNTSGNTVRLGNITIKGGTVIAKGCLSANGWLNSNGIGTGYCYPLCTNKVGTITIYDGVDLIDALSISDFDNVVYMHEDTDVTSNKTDYFNIGKTSNNMRITKKDSTSYTVDVSNDIKNGSVTTSLSKYRYCEAVSLNVTPDTGYQLKSITVKDSSGNNVAVDGYSFFMPKGNVTVTAEFVEITANFDESTGVLTLKGNVDADDVKRYSNNINVNSVVCEKGTVLPENCNYLFKNFSAATIDLSNADFSKVKNVTYMFNNCTELTAIYVSDSFNANNISGNYIFKNSTNLVGGSGTHYTDMTNDIARFQIDGKNGQPGYFTGVYTVTIPDYLEVVQDDTEHKVGDKYLKGAVIKIRCKDYYSANAISYSSVIYSAMNDDGTFDVYVPGEDVTVKFYMKEIRRNVKVSDSINGTVTADKTQAKFGDTVTLTVTPDEGYYAKSVTVDGEELPPTDGQYTFTMPEKNVEVTAEFAERVDISTAKLTANPLVFAYDSEEHTVSGALRLDGHLLVKDVDYIITGNTATEKGTYTLVAEGIGKYWK